MRLVIRVGGSVVASPLNAKLIFEYVKLLLELKQQGHTILAVIGGGSFSRDLIKISRDIGLRQRAQDEVAISASRVVAQLFVLRLGRYGTMSVPITIEDSAELLKNGKIVVTGGLEPGMTTDGVAAMLAERVNADLLVKASNVDGIYTKDPKKHKEAEKFEKLRFKDLRELFSKKKHKPGINQVIDPKAVRILQKNKIKIIFVNGFQPSNLLSAIKGERVGTLISD